MLSAGSKNIYNELGINVGATSIQNESGSRFSNMGFGLSYQMSKYMVSPRVDLDYVSINDFEGVDSLLKLSINGLYEFETSSALLPYALFGLGYENVSSEVKGSFESHPFVQGGLGVGYLLKNGYKAKLEGKMLQILGGDDENNEMIITLGMSIPIGNTHTKHKKKRRVIRRTQTKIIRQKIPVYIDKSQCRQKINRPDRDRDGIEDRIDQCPNTPCDFTVDGYGCPVKATLRINFATASARIEPHSIARVQNFANFLLRNRGSMVKIVGHTDSVGKNSYNLSLSQRRAKSVANKLIEFGVSPARISSRGMGESRPVANNATAYGKRQNRRIEAILSYPNSRR
jgi:OOP family OmpA-OmpF porin